MSSLKLFWISAIALTLTACASGGGSSARLKAGKDQSLPYLRGVRGVSAPSISGSCPAESWASLNWRRLNDAANRCIQEGQWSTVKKMGHHLAEKFYHSPWGAYYLSLYYDQSGDKDRALWFIEAAMSKSGMELGLLHYQKGKVLLSLADPTGAHDSFEQAVKLDSELADAHIYLGQQAYMDGDHAKAGRHLDKAFAMNRLQEASHFQMLARSHEKRKKWSEAIAVLDRGLRIHRNSLELKLQRASVLEDGLKDLRAALRAYEDVLKLQAQSSQNSAPVQNKIDQIRKTLEQSDKNERSPATREERA